MQRRYKCVRHPFPVRRVGLELAIEQVRCDRQAVIGISGLDASPLALPATDIMDAHQTFYALLVAMDALALDQFGVNAWAAVGLTTGSVDLLDPVHQLQIVLCALALWSSTPGIVAARRDRQHTAHTRDGKLVTVIGDKLILHGCFCAKMEMAFLKCHAPDARSRYRVGAGGSPPLAP